MWQDISLFSGCVIVYMWSSFSAIWNANLTHFVLATFMNIKNMDKIIVNTWNRSLAPNFSAMKFSYWCSRRKIENFTSLYCHECPKFNWKFHFKCTLSGTSWWHETLMPMTQQPPRPKQQSSFMLSETKCGHSGDFAPALTSCCTKFVVKRALKKSFSSTDQAVSTTLHPS